MRPNILKRTALLGNYPHSNRVLWAELAILGEFYEVPEFLFGRQVHPKIAQRANPNDKSYAVWFDPNNRGKVIFPSWQHYFEYCHAMQKAQLPWDEQIRCYMQIMRRLLLSPRLLKKLKKLKGITQDWLKVPPLFLYLVIGRGKQQSQAK